MATGTTRNARRVAAVAAVAIAVSLSAGVVGAEPQAGPAPLATIKDIRRTVLSDAVRVTIELDREVQFHDERIPDPTRVFVDIPGTRPTSSLSEQTMRFEVDADIVRQIRLGRHPNNTTRVVLDAADVSTYSVYPLYDPFRIVIDCVRTKPAQTATVAPPPVPPPVVRKAVPPLIAKRAPMYARLLPVHMPRSTRLLMEAYARLDRDGAAATNGVVTDASLILVAPDAPVISQEPAGPAPAAVITSTLGAVPAAVPPAKNVNGGFSMSRQLGLGVSRIVIDPGHGGHDPGAQGKGVSESEVVLDIALKLEKLLQKVPGVEVILTRRTDEFIPLQERTAIANREGADLFLSIHANASPNAQARGVETYFLNFANNLSAAAVAARENATSGQAMGALPDLVRTIALNNKLDESKDFATHIQRMMFERLRSANATVKDLGVKQAPFVVLIGASMPSVLAEISFVTNPQEARLLKGGPYRQKIADALFTAIRKYQTSLKNPAAVASP
jgi:N-acetylmuramoyl-L-alanine amidase